MPVYQKAVQRRKDRWNAVTGYCICSKTDYITIAVARKAAHEAEERGEGKHRVYRCPNRARTWHITHTPPLGVDYKAPDL